MRPQEEFCATSQSTTPQRRPHAPYGFLELDLVSELVWAPRERRSVNESEVAHCCETVTNRA